MVGRDSSASSGSRRCGGIISRRPRFTQDIDALAIISESEWTTAVAAAASYGIARRIDDAVEFAHRSRVLLLRHQETQIDIDVILGGLPFEEDAVVNGKRYVIGGVSVRLPKVEDLMIRRPSRIDQGICKTLKVCCRLIRIWICTAFGSGSGNLLL